MTLLNLFVNSLQRAGADFSANVIVSGAADSTGVTITLAVDGGATIPNPTAVVQAIGGSAAATFHNIGAPSAGTLTFTASAMDNLGTVFPVSSKTVTVQ